MRLPWSRQPQEGTDETPPAQPRALAPARPAAAWACLPPVPRVLDPIGLTTSPIGFATGLAAWRSSALTGPASTQVAPSMPLRSRSALQRTADDGQGQPSSNGPVALHVAPRPAGKYAVQRAETRAGAGSARMVVSPPSGMPVVQLTAEPLPPQLLAQEPQSADPMPSDEEAKEPQSIVPGSSEAQDAPELMSSPVPETEVANGPSEGSTLPLDASTPVGAGTAAERSPGGQPRQTADPDQGPAVPVQRTSDALDRRGLPVAPARSGRPIDAGAPVDGPAEPGSGSPTVAIEAADSAQRRSATGSAIESDPIQRIPQSPSTPATPPAMAKPTEPSVPAPPPGPSSTQPRNPVRLGLGEPLPSLPLPVAQRSVGRQVGEAASPAVPRLTDAVRAADRHDVPGETVVDLPAVPRQTVGEAAPAAPAEADWQHRTPPDTPDLPLTPDAEVEATSGLDGTAEPAVAGQALLDPPTPEDPPASPDVVHVEPVTDPADSPLPLVQRAVERATEPAPSLDPQRPSEEEAVGDAAPYGSTSPNSVAPEAMSFDGPRSAEPDDPSAMFQADGAPTQLEPPTPSGRSGEPLTVVPVQRMTDEIWRRPATGPESSGSQGISADRATDASRRPERDAPNAASSGPGAWPVVARSVQGQAARSVQRQHAGLATGQAPELAHKGPAFAGMPLPAALPGRPVASGSAARSAGVVLAEPAAPVTPPPLDLPLGTFGAGSAAEQLPHIAAGPSEPALVQRVVDVAPPEPQRAHDSDPTGIPNPAPAQAEAAHAPAHQPAAVASSADVDELARKLYDPLMQRLRADLLVERERRGLRTDVW